MAHYTERENEETARMVVEQTIAQNSLAAQMDKEKLFEMVRKMIRQRFERFERTGDASGITVLKTPAVNPPPPEQSVS